MPTSPIAIQNWDFSVPEQNVNPAGAYYPLQGWNEISGNNLRWDGVTNFGGAIATGIWLFNSDQVSGSYSLIQGITNPLLVAGEQYNVTVTLIRCAVATDYYVVLGGTSGVAHAAPTATATQTFTETITCGSDGTGLVLKCLLTSDQGLTPLSNGGWYSIALDLVTPAPITLECAITSAQSANIGDTFSVSATGGTGTYSWSATGGTPSSGSGSTFDTTYTTGGTKTITVTSGAQSCSQTVYVAFATPQPEPAPPQEPVCHEVADGSVQIQSLIGNRVMTLMDGTRFDFNRPFTRYAYNSTVVVNTMEVEDCIRLSAIFVEVDPEEDQKEIRFNSGLVQSTRQEIIRNYTLETDPSPKRVLDRILRYTTFANETLVTDYNECNPDFDIKQRSVMRKGEWKMIYHKGSRLIGVEARYVDRIRNIESRICF